MRTIIHDFENLDFLDLNSDDVVLENKIKNSCVGCFSCWVKKSFECIFKDQFKNNGKTLLNSDELVIISKCVNGCYSSLVKRILERSISYVRPYFGIREGEIHHKVRTEKQLDFKVIFYNDVSDEEKEVAYSLINANRKNLNTKRPEVIFVDEIKKIKEVL